MAIHIIDNKKIDLTGTEWDMYQKICKSYDTMHQKGKDLFVDLFETDDNGMIIFLRPPSKRVTSFEIFFFLMAIMEHQHLRVVHQQIDELCKRVDDKLKELESSAK